MTGDPRFGILREALAAHASDADDAARVSAGVFEAAVALVVRGREPLELLLIKRARRQGDPWSGHIALPGGRRDQSDDSLVRTAVRETEEETGLDLDQFGLHLGQLEALRPSSTVLPQLSVTPQVFGVPADSCASAVSAEVEAVHWIALDVLHLPETRSEAEVPLPGGACTSPCFRIGDDIVWGLTYRILDDFLARAPRVFPPR